MRKNVPLFCSVLGFILVGCNTVVSTPSIIIATATSNPTATLLPSPTETTVPTPTSTIEPTPIPPTPTPTSFFITERQKIRNLMVGYGRVDEKYLSDAYWGKMSQAIAKYGPAQRILTLEYHGDSYAMYDHYSMTPEQFETQMRYFLDNDYHFVTGPEIVGYLEGWLSLPARSVILTTDSWQGSSPSFARIIAFFSQLESEYGVSPHLNSFIWTLSMTSAENQKCQNDFCWQFFREALNSGYFTFGTHTETHRDFATLTNEDTIWDINRSKQEIKDALGLSVYSLSWPLEACSANPGLISSLGIKYAFGGYTRDMNRLFAYSGDNMPECLPRLFPPNPNGLSGRPGGLTLEEMLLKAQNEYFPLY